MSKDTSVKDCYGLCGGTGEVQITPYGQADIHADVFGCPACIQADRDKAERERDQLLVQRDILIQQNARLMQDGLASIEALGKAMRQRDELLAVLEAMLEEVAGCYCTTEASARAVIQKVRGGE